MAHRLFSDPEIRRLRNLFQEFDEDGSGAISADEARQSINKFGIKISDQQLLALVQKVDSDKSGSINFVEFMKFATFAKETEVETEKASVKSREFNAGAANGAVGATGAAKPTGAAGASGPAGTGHKSEELPEKLLERIKKLFKEFDKDGSGTVEAAEISNIMEKFGVKLTMGQVNGLIRLVDDDNSGELDVDEFIELVRLALNPGSTPRLKKSGTVKSRSFNPPPSNSGSDDSNSDATVKSRSFNAPPANSGSDGSSSDATVKSRSFNTPPEDSGSDGSNSSALVVDPNSDATVKSRSFNLPPTNTGSDSGSDGSTDDATVKSRSYVAPPVNSESDDSTSLAVAVDPNSDAAGNVDFYGTLPLTLRNKLALTTPVRPFSFALKEVLTSGTYKIQLISQLYAPAWGRWAGLVKPENVNLKEYHIIEENALDHDVVQISILGVKSGGKWRHKKADYVQPAGRVDLVLEYQSDAGTLLASWNGQILPFGVNKIPQGQQRFTFELPNSLEVTIQSLVKVPTPTLKPTGNFDFYSY